VTRAFLAALWGDRPAIATLGYVRRGERSWQTEHFEAPAEMAARATELADLADVYFRVCPLRDVPDKGRGGEEFTGSIPGFWIDLDIGGAAKNGKLRVPTDDDADRVLADAGVPDPTIAVRSGSGGLHLYWLFEGDPRPIADAAELAAWRRESDAWQGRIVSAAEARGWCVDTTSDLARVLRMPGTKNWKTPAGSPVELVALDGPRIPVPDLAPLAQVSTPSTPVTPSYGPPTPDEIEAIRERLRELGPDRADGSGLPAWRLGMILSNDWALSEAEAIGFAREWNATCEPPYEEEDLVRKLRSGKASARGEYGRAREAHAHTRNMRAFLQAVSSGNRKPETGEPQCIVQRGGSYYLLRPDGGYHPPVGDRDFLVAARERLSWTGLEVPASKEKEDFLARFSTVADTISASVSLQRSRWDAATRTLHEATCPLRELGPMFHSDVDRWLRLLGGELQDKLLDWIATVTLLDRPSAALVICGPNSVGKALLALGLASLWRASGGPTEMRQAIGGFNSSVASCPLVWADEGLPRLPNGARATEILREEIGNATRKLSRKFLPDATLTGALRYVITANNDGVLDFSGEETTDADLDALGKRFLVIDLGRDDRAAVFLRELGGYAATTPWIAGDAIARHALWLRENRPVELGSRFCVEGNYDARKLALHDPFVGRLFERVRDALRVGTPTARIEGNVLWIAVELVKRDWWRGGSEKTPIDARRIVTAIRKVRPRAPEIPETKVLGRDKTRATYRSVDLDLYTEWVRKTFGEDDKTEGAEGAAPVLALVPEVKP
jgi:hypothetical protein